MRTLTAIAVALGLAIPAAAQMAVPETDTASPIDIEGYELVDPATDPIILEELVGEPVYSALTDERIGEVDEVYTQTESGHTYLGLEVGGWLGIGDKEVAVPLDQVSIYRGDDWRIYVQASEEQLEASPEYDLD